MAMRLDYQRIKLHEPKEQITELRQAVLGKGESPTVLVQGVSSIGKTQLVHTAFDKGLSSDQAFVQTKIPQHESQQYNQPSMSNRISFAS